MTILSIDPGTAVSGWCTYRDGRVLWCGTDPNDAVLELLARPEHQGVNLVAIEMVASYGMPVGREVFETCVWIGRMLERATALGVRVRLIYRRDVKIHLCQSARAKDPNVRQALLDLLGPVGTKAHPGPLYGVSGHVWAAVAVAVYVQQVPEQTTESADVEEEAVCT